MEGRTFPLEFSKCPACQSTCKITDIIREEEIAKGKMSPDIVLYIGRTITPLLDPSKRALAVFSVPGIVAYYNICAECGCYYCVRAEKAQGQLQPVSLPVRNMPPLSGIS